MEQIRDRANERHHSAWGSSYKVIYEMFFGRLTHLEEDHEEMIR